MQKPEETRNLEAPLSDSKSRNEPKPSAQASGETYRARNYAAWVSEYSFASRQAVKRKKVRSSAGDRTSKDARLLVLRDELLDSTQTMSI